MEKSSKTVAICITKSDPIPWQLALQAALPDCKVNQWFSESSGQKNVATTCYYAVVWHPTQNFIDFHRETLKVIFVIGAGVDAVLRTIRIPKDVIIIRLDDAGMAVQMAEYCCYYVCRYFRDMPIYEKQQLNKRWNDLSPRSRSEFPIAIIGMGIMVKKK